MHLFISFFVTDFVRKNLLKNFFCSMLIIYKNTKPCRNIIFHHLSFAFSCFLSLTLHSIDVHSFKHITNRQFSKTLWEKKKLLVMSNFFFSHNVFYSIRKLYPHLSIFLTSYLYLQLN